MGGPQALLPAPKPQCITLSPTKFLNIEKMILKKVLFAQNPLCNECEKAVRFVNDADIAFSEPPAEEDHTTFEKKNDDPRGKKRALINPSFVGLHVFPHPYERHNEGTTRNVSNVNEITMGRSSECHIDKAC